jgi:hypothetical protein
LKLRKLKGLLAIAAAPFRHKDVVASPAWGTGGPATPSRFRNCCRVRTASPPMSSSRTTTKPGKLRGF